MNKNNMICDLETGVCGVGGEEEMELVDFNQLEKKITLYYVTDPICSHCWALEPVLKRFVEQYGHYFKFQTVMGGLLPSWNGFADKANGIGGPSDVAGHWREVGVYARMPIDGNVWIQDPIQSSFPSSRVFKIIQQKDEQLADIYLRRAREAVFLFNQNIGDNQVLTNIVNAMNLDGTSIVKEADLSSGRELLDEDFKLSRKLGVRGFPTIIMVNEENKGIKIVGARSIEEYVKGLQEVLSTSEEIKAQPPRPLKKILGNESLLFSKEIEEMYGLEKHEVKEFIKKELPTETYEVKEILDELYIKKVESSMD